MDTKIFPRGPNAVEIHTELTVAPGNHLFTDLGYLDLLIIRSLGIEASKIPAGEYKVEVTKLD